MKKSLLFVFFGTLLTPIAIDAAAPTGRVPLADRVVHYASGKNRKGESVHGGAGSLHYQVLMGAEALGTNFIFLHRGELQPKSGIGVHFHNRCEEMFVILDGEAEFTVNGRTALIKGPAAVPCRAGSAHGIYNPTDRPVQWMNVNVGFTKTYDAFDINDPRVGVNLDPIPQFISARLDRTLARPVENMNGGMGTVQYRRAFEPSVFLTTWSYVDHLIIPAGATVGPNGPSDVSETCYAMAGDGTVTLGGETVAFKAGDSLAVEAGQAKSFAGGSEPLQILVIGVARDMASKEALMARPRPRSGK